MTPTAVQTAEDLLHFREPGKTAELVRGVLIVREPPGTGHGACSARLTLRVGAFVEQRELGEVFAQDTAFKIERDPDVGTASGLTSPCASAYRHAGSPSRSFEMEPTIPTPRR